MKGALFLIPCVALILAASHAVMAFAADEPKDDPPSGIVPTTATLGQVLKAHDAAAGTLVKNTASIRTEVWQFTDAGAEGTERLVRRASDYHSVIKTGPFVEEFGQLGDARWHKNQNGVVCVSTLADTGSFLMFRVLEDASDPKNDVKLLGEVQNPSPAYVVEVTRPQVKHPEWVFFDKRTALVIRTEEIVTKHRLVSTYDDYQTVQGLTEPAHVHDSTGTQSLDADYRRQSLAFSNTANPAEFAQPPSIVTYMQIDHPVNLDAHVAEGTVVVRLTVNGRGLDFELSSGDRHSYIDSGVARELQLPSFGHVTQADGKPVPYESELADASTGSLHIQHFALEVLPFNYHADIATKVVGTLGYDFLSRGLFSVDYVNSRVTAGPIPAAPIEPSGEGMYVLPIRFDDGLPFITSVIASHETDRVLLDSSFDFSFIFGSFTQTYPDAVVDAEGGRQHKHTVVPFADSGSYGRDVDVWLANVPDLRIGPTHFLDYKIAATNAAFDAGDRPIDAIMGTQFLIFYDVFYDFAHDRVLLKQNEYFKKTFHIRKN